MKCSSCGANLQIDNEFCPYCGKQNMIAKKHREDMKRYETNYRRTREEVIGNSKKFNQRTFKITAIAVTLTVLLIAIGLIPISERLGYKHMREEGRRRAEESEKMLEYYINNDDYAGYRAYIVDNNLYFDYRSKVSDYSSPAAMASSFTSLIEIAYSLNGNTPKDVSFSKPEYVSSYVNSIYENEERIAQMDIADNIKTFSRHMCEDMELMLNTYFGIPLDVARNFPNMSEAQRSIAIEEGYAYVKENR